MPAGSFQDFGVALQRYASWMRGAALPLWEERAWDAARGGFYESLRFDGRPVEDAVRRVRVQARQTHVFATATRLGWCDGERLARQGFQYLLDRACPEQGARGCVHRLNPDGSVADPRRDLYDQAFLLLACAATWRAFKDRRALDLAARTIAFLDRELASPSGGYLEDDLNSLPRRQNPHMHLFEAFMALIESTGEQAHLRRADAVLDLFHRKFFDVRRGVLVEFFDADWRPDPQKGDLMEPGHMMEWVWLLARFEALGGKPKTGAEGNLFEGASRFGADKAGFLVDEMRLGALASGPRRLWPQTEHLKACIVRAGAGDEAAARTGAELISRLFETYLAEPVAGLWCDRFDADGARIAKDAPASILYHIFDAAVEAQSYLDRS